MLYGEQIMNYKLRDF